MHKYNVKLEHNLIPLHQTNRLNRHVQDTVSAFWKIVPHNTEKVLNIVKNHLIYP